MDGARDALSAGARLFDEGAFFAAHEAWEERWRVETDPAARRLLQGLIQIAAGFHKLLVLHGPASAERLLAKGLAKLDGGSEAPPSGRVGTTSQPECFPRQEDASGGLDLTAFADGVRACLRAIASGRLDRAAIPRLGDLGWVERPSSPE